MDESIQFLRADTIVDCRSYSYGLFLYFTTIATVIYLAIPAYFYYLVFVIRDTVNPSLRKHHTLIQGGQISTANPKKETTSAGGAYDDDEDDDEVGGGANGAPILSAEARDLIIKGSDGRHGDVFNASAGLGCGGSSISDAATTFSESERALKVKLREKLRCDCVTKFLWQGKMLVIKIIKSRDSQHSSFPLVLPCPRRL